MSISQDILAYLVAHSTRRLKKTDLVKLVYLVDWKHLSLYGRQATDVAWIRNRYGPYAPSITDDLYALQSREQIAVKETTNFFGGPMYLHDATPITQIPELPYQLKTICDSTLNLYGQLPLDKIKDAAYSTSPDGVHLGTRAQGGTLHVWPSARFRALCTKEVQASCSKRGRAHQARGFVPASHCCDSRI